MITSIQGGSTPLFGAECTAASAAVKPENRESALKG